MSSARSSAPASRWIPERPTLARLARAADGCRACPLYRGATQAVVGEGNAAARLMLVGEMPGDEEDRAGRPFVGPAGRFLDEMLQEVGLDRDELYLTNAVKHFKFVLRGKRRIHQTPSASEVSSCGAWLETEVDLVEPEMILCLGATASRAVIGRDVRITRDHGRVFTDREVASWLMPTYHPSAILRGPDRAARRELEGTVRADLEAAVAHYRQLA